jgi:opacity protein-like surface antigen
MQKTLFILLTAAFLMGTASAQDKNVFIKWAPASLAAGKVTVGTEYHFKKKQSLEFFVGIPVAVNKEFEYDGNTSELESKAFSIFAGYRYYFGRRGASGFYVEPYVKYLKHETDGFLEGDLDGEYAKFATRTEYKGFGAGAQLGVQFLIAKRVSLDLFLLGPEANSAKFSSISTDVADNIPWTFVDAREAEQNVKDALSDIPIIGDKIEVQVNQAAKTVSTKYDGFLPGLRLGASIGIRL